MARSPRAGARRRMKVAFDQMKRDIDKLRSWWTSASYVHMDRAEMAERGIADPCAYRRDREVHEYPEAQRIYWASTVAEIDKMIDRLRTALVAGMLENAGEPGPN